MKPEWFIIRVWHFDFQTSRFRNFSNCCDSIGIGFEICWYLKKYRYQFRKKLVSKKVSVSVSKNLGIKKVSVSVSKIFGIEKSIGIGFVKFWYRKKYRYRYRKKIGIGKSIGFGIEKIWYRKKVSDSVSFRFWVSSHTEWHLVTSQTTANCISRCPRKKLWARIRSQTATADWLTLDVSCYHHHCRPHHHQHCHPHCWISFIITDGQAKVSSWIAFFLFQGN